MNHLKDEAEMLEPQALIHHLVYTDVNRHTAVELMEPFWADYDTLYGNHYGYGTRHTITIPALGEPVDYVVAMVPFIRQVPHPGIEGKKVQMRTVYFVKAELWPLMNNLQADDIDNSVLPEVD